METANIDIFQAIVDAVTIDNERKIYFYEKEYRPFQMGEGLTKPSQEMLAQALQQLIYAEFYCKDPATENLPQNQTFNTEENIDFIKCLQAANQSTERWDKNWMVENVDVRGVLTIKKGNFCRHAFGGEYIKGNFSHQPAQKGETVKLLARNEYYAPHQAFYFVFGETITEDNPQALVRFYFNVTPKGAPELIKQITSSFNKHLIPFQAKCLNNPANYTRSDSAVLYLDKRYFKQGMGLIKNLYEELRPYFKTCCPAFTKQLADGLAFAENPPNPEDSFGTSRCNIIAQGILSAYNNGLPKAQWFNEIIQQIKKLHFSIDRFYLNPKSYFPYQFPII